MVSEYNLKKYLNLLIALALLFFFSNCTVLRELSNLSEIQKEEYKMNLPESKARLVHIGEYPVLHLYGNPEQMGTQYGTLLKPQLNSLFLILTSVFEEKDLDDYLQLAKDIEPNLPEEIRTELKAVSKSSGVDYDLLVAMNAATKIDCSTLAAWGESTADGQLIMGRNADYKTKGLNKYLGLIIVRHPENGFASVNITYLGLIGSYSGINEKGVCYGNMLSYNGEEDSTNVNGIPIHLLMRIAAEESETSEEYKNFLLRYHVMIPNIVMSADKEKALITELTQNNCDFREGYKGILASSNFFHSNKLAIKHEADERYSVIMNEAKTNYGTINVDTVKEIMYKARRKGKNVQCVIFEPGKMLIYVSINKTPASAGPFAEINIKNLLE